MDYRRTILSVSLMVFAGVLLGAPVLRAQDATADDKGVNSGNYNISAIGRIRIPGDRDQWE